jgi:chromosome segregation protein
MFLISLDIVGFKSFADRTHIEFAEGITALLGPNGCGKSNVVDAIKWVLGEQKSGAMRAERMEDVIFAGTETRQPMSAAQVTLTISNASGLLPADVPTLEITRRLNRNGDSTYRINGREAKLKELRALFWDTGVGKGAYSVMEQGKIDQILSSKPEERRYLFEEAAGITRNKAQSREAELKLARAAENMQVVAVEVAEAKKTYDTLKEQAEKTALFRSLNEEVFGLERDMQLLRLRAARHEEAERRERLSERRQAREAAQSALDTATQEASSEASTLAGIRAEVVDAEKRVFGLAKEEQGLEEKHRLLEEQREQNRLALIAGEERERAVTVKIDELLADADEQDAVARDAQRRVEDAERAIAEHETALATAAARITENDGTARRRETESALFEERRAALEQDLAAITDDIVAELDKRLKETRGVNSTDATTTAAAIDTALAALADTLAGLHDGALSLARAAGRHGTPVQPAEVARVASALATQADDASATLERLAADVAAFKAASPASLIDDFLAPEGILTRKRAVDDAIREAKREAAARRDDITRLHADNAALAGEITAARATLDTLRENRATLGSDARAAFERAKSLRRELVGQQAVQKSAADEVFLARKRKGELDERLADTDEDIASLKEMGETLAASLEKLGKDIARREQAATAREVALEEARKAVATLNTDIERLTLDLARSDIEIKNIEENFRETHSRELAEFADREAAITDTPSALREKRAAAKARLDALGQVNLMAPEDFVEASERYERISTQMADLEKAAADLEHLVTDIREKASNKFMATYNNIKRSFHNMFRRLFGGGRAELRLVDSDHVLESGIEILAQPPGKRLESIALLSGGEKAMTAVALLFATYLVKPSPFCLLDEIDAALDEENVGRFVQTLRDFGHSSQFVVITHNKKTVLAASALIGVTMQEKGVTTLVQQRLENRETAESQALRTDNDDFVDEEVVPETGRELPPE